MFSFNNARVCLKPGTLFKHGHACSSVSNSHCKLCLILSTMGTEHVNFALGPQTHSRFEFQVVQLECRCEYCFAIE